MEELEFRQSSFRDFLRVIFKRKKQILLFFAVTVCTVAIGTFMVKPTYEARAQVLVKIGRENLYVPPSEGKSTFINFNSEDQINSEIELLKSRSLIDKVVETLGPDTIYKDLDYKDVVLKFQKALWVGGIKKSNVIAISFKHEDPQMAAKIVNTLTSAFLDQHLLVHKNSQSYNFFEEQSQILEKKLEHSEAALETFKKQNRITALDEEQKLLLVHIADLNAELNQTLRQEAETKNRILQIRQQLYKTPENIPQGKEVDHNPYLISNLEARLVELQLKQKELLIKYTPQSRLVKNVNEEIQMVQEKLAQNEKKQYGKSHVGLNTTYQRLQEKLFQNQAEAKALAAKRETLNTQLTNSQDKLEQLNQMEVELNRLEQSVDVNRQNYRLYLAKFEESRISDAMDNKKIANVSLMQSALTPLKPISPKVLLNIVLAVFLGGFGGLGWAFFTEYLDDSLGTPEHVEKALQLPVLASIPKLELSDTQAPSNFTPMETRVTTVEKQSPWRLLQKAATVCLVIGLLFAGNYFLDRTAFQFTGLTQFISEINDTVLNVIQPDHQKYQAQLAFTNTPTQPVALGKVIIQNSTGEDAEPKPHADSEVNDTDLNLTQPNTENQQQPLLFNDLPAQPISVSKIFIKDLVEQRSGVKIRLLDEKRSDLSVPVKKEEQKIKHIKVEKGETLFRIIIQTYGAYNDEILNKVLRANPDIIGPAQIHAGQTIKLPVDID